MKVRLWLGLALGVAAALPFVVPPIAENVATRAARDHLTRIPFMIGIYDPPMTEAVAMSERVVIARLDMQGATVMRTARSSVDLADAQLPPWPARNEVREARAGNRTFGRYPIPDGLSVVHTLAQPRPDGGVLYILAVSQRAFQQRVVVLYASLYDLALGVVVIIVWRRLRRRRTPEGA